MDLLRWFVEKKTMKEKKDKQGEDKHLQPTRQIALEHWNIKSSLLTPS